MEYLTQQFIAAKKKFHEELHAIKEALSSIKDSLQKQTDAISSVGERASQQQHPPPEVRAEVHFPESVERSRRSNDDRQYGLQQALVIATWATFFAVVIYAGVAALQWHQMKKATKATQEAANAATNAADTAKKQLESSVRPWVGITGSGIGEIKLTLVEKQPLGITIRGQNVGSSPALNETGVNKMTVGPATPVPTFGDYSKAEAGPPVVLFPGAIFTVKLGTDKPSNLGNVFKPLSATDIKAIRSGKIRVWVYGSMWYDDMLHSREHRTDYCFQYDFEGSSDTVTSFAACETHNYAD